MKYLITSALPYANAPLHLGHILEIIQTDVWVRHLNLKGLEAHYFCASDTHGTPVMLKSKEENITPEKLIENIYGIHKNTFTNYNVNLANFHSTHSDENKQLTIEIFKKALDKGFVYTKKIKQLFDNEENMFLSDRFVKGTCPACGAADQYGDACEVCGSTYDALDLSDPISTLSDSKPSIKESEHYFFKLNELSGYLSSKVDELSNQSPIKHKLKEWLDGELKDWDVSRDEPYFGFKVPGEENKYIYVWMDAPVGYLSSIKNWCDKNKYDYEKLLSDKDTKLVHFIGKDIVYFHLLFWPAMLHAADIENIEEVFVHGFLTIEGMKMSKSRGNFILADKALEYANADFYRYYLSSKLNTDISDINFSVDDFVQKINSDLIGKYINIASRTQNFLTKHNNSEVKQNCQNETNKYKDLYAEIIGQTNDREYSKALKNIMSIADEANSYISSMEPWSKAKDGDIDSCIEICSESLNLFKDLTILLSPYIPNITESLFELLNLKQTDYDQISKDCLTEVKPFKAIITRLEKSEFEGILN
jgi:methionyl-tRNA synthetase